MPDDLADSFSPNAVSFYCENIDEFFEKLSSFQLGWARPRIDSRLTKQFFECGFSSSRLDFDALKRIKKIWSYKNM